MPAPPTRQGYLHKLPISHSQKIRRGWKKRYFVLDGDKLSYYPRHPAQSAKGVVKISHCSVIDADKLTKRDLCFAIIFKNSQPNRYLYLRAETDEDKKRWMEELKSTAASTDPSTKKLGTFQSAAAVTPARNVDIYTPALNQVENSFLDLPPMVWENPLASYEGEVNSVGQRDGRGTCQAGTAMFQGEWTFDIPQNRGVHIWADGRKYSGQWKDGLPHGFGRLESPDNRVYEGEWYEGEPHGEGRLEELDGSIYEGTFVHKRRKGVGSTRWPNQNVYTGDFDDNCMHGSGILMYADGSGYEGDFRWGTLHGQGELRLANGDVFRGKFERDSCVDGEIKYANGSRYEGQMKDGKRHGSGKMVSANGDVFIGEFKDGHRWGKGSLVSSKGDEYDGEWEGDLQNGFGKMSYRNGNQYHGDWLRGKRHGKGEFFYRSGNRFRGEYIDGFPHGKGVFFYKEGHRYTGQFVRGKKTGQGTFMFADGRTYQGEWQNDELCGQGTMSYTNGDSYYGTWSNYKWNGPGEYRFANGNVYKANFEEGQFPEIGTMHYLNGNRFQGRVDRQGRRQGVGVMFWSNGERFEGTFCDDKRHGTDCVMYMIDGTEAVGDYDMGVAIRVEVRRLGDDEAATAEKYANDADSPKKGGVKNWLKPMKKKKKRQTEVIDFAAENEEKSSEVLSSSQRLVLPTPADAGAVLDDISAESPRTHSSLPSSQSAVTDVKTKLWSAQESRLWNEGNSTLQKARSVSVQNAQSPASAQAPPLSRSHSATPSSVLSSASFVESPSRSLTESIRKLTVPASAIEAAEAAIRVAAEANALASEANATISSVASTVSCLDSMRSTDTRNQASVVEDAATTKDEDAKPEKPLTIVTEQKDSALPPMSVSKISEAPDNTLGFETTVAPVITAHIPATAHDGSSLHEKTGMEAIVQPKMDNKALAAPVPAPFTNAVSMRDIDIPRTGSFDVSDLLSPAVSSPSAHMASMATQLSPAHSTTSVATQADDDDVSELHQEDDISARSTALQFPSPSMGSLATPENSSLQEPRLQDHIRDTSVSESTVSIGPELQEMAMFNEWRGDDEASLPSMRSLDQSPKSAIATSSSIKQRKTGGPSIATPIAASENSSATTPPVAAIATASPASSSPPTSPTAAPPLFGKVQVDTTVETANHLPERGDSPASKALSSPSMESMASSSGSEFGFRADEPPPRSEELSGKHSPGAYTNLPLDEWDTRDLVEWLEDNYLSELSGAFVSAKIDGVCLRQYDKRIVDLPIDLDSFSRVKRMKLILAIDRLYDEHPMPAPARDSIRLWRQDQSTVPYAVRSSVFASANRNADEKETPSAVNSAVRMRRQQHDSGSTISRLKMLWEAKSENNQSSVGPIKRYGTGANPRK